MRCVPGGGRLSRGQSEWSVESWQMSELVSVLGCLHLYLSASQLGQDVGSFLYASLNAIDARLFTFMLFSYRVMSYFCTVTFIATYGPSEIRLLNHHCQTIATVGPNYRFLSFPQCVLSFLKTVLITNVSW